PGTGSGDPGTPGSGSCRDQLKIYAEQLKSQGIKSRELIEHLRARSVELNCTFNKGKRSYMGQSIHGLVGKSCDKNHSHAQIEDPKVVTTDVPANSGHSNHGHRHR